VPEAEERRIMEEKMRMATGVASAQPAMAATG
jgi:hypothetical protein